MINKGKLTISLTLVITFMLWLPQYQGELLSILTLSRITALLGTVLLAWEYMLATRAQYIEEIFDGLDTVYKVHHWVGKYGFILILLHPLTLLINAITNGLNWQIYLLPSQVLSYSVGVYALYTLCILLFVTLILKIPYHLWKLTHNFMGVPLLFLMIHILLISSDVSSNGLLRIWITGFVFLGILAYLYKRFVYNRINGYEYRVESVQRASSNAHKIRLNPKNRIVQAEPGQFIFIKTVSKSRNKELHPFTVSSREPNGTIEFIVKNLGDYTNEIKNLNPGESIVIYGPHGRFGKHFVAGEREVWIAGGIGITPFLSVMQEYARSGKQLDVTLYYIVKNVDDFIEFERLSEYSRQIQGFTLIAHDSSVLGHVNPASFFDIRANRYVICASNRLENSIREGLLNLGVDMTKIKSEAFSLY